EHLDLVASRRQAEDLGARQRIGQAANVVTSQGWPQYVMVLQEKARQLFEVSVALPFLGEDRHRPTLLGGHHGFIIPVRPLAAPHAGWGEAGPAPPGWYPRDRSDRTGYTATRA